MRNNKNHGLLALAVAAVLPGLMAASAFGQYRVGADGHANDASNRVGSGGFNTPNDPNHNQYSNNTNILTGNVGGSLNYFHGTTGIFDQNTFQGNTESESNHLNQVSAQPYRTPAGPPTNLPAYYNRDQLVGNAPVPLELNRNGTGYKQVAPVNPLTPNPDSRVNFVQTTNPTGDLLPAPGELDVAGPVDNSGVQSLYTMSPLYGMRKNDMSDSHDAFFLSQYSNYRTTTPAQRSRMDNQSIDQMQRELATGEVNSGDTLKNSNSNNTDSGNPANPANSAAINPGSIANGAIPSSQLPNQPLGSTVSPSTVGNDLSSGSGFQTRVIVPADKQSKQIADLERKYAGQKMTDQQAMDQANDIKRLMDKQARDNKPGGKPGDQNQPGNTGPGNTGPGNSGPGGNAPGALPGSNNYGGTGAGLSPLPGHGAAGSTGTVTAPLAVPGNPKGPDAKPVLPADTDANKPYMVTSLATGIRAKGLADLLKSAQEQMRVGKFSQAIDTYNTAEEVAPNNAFIPLGRGFAELGRSYYAKADTDLSHAIAMEPAVLAGQYDLKGFLGEDRLAFVQKDLGDVAARDKGARPMVLLAYIAHNQGDDTTAAKDLNDAGTRGGYDALIKQMREAWGLK